MARKYEADDIRSIAEDRDRVRKRPSMYIPSTGKGGAEHIIFEIVDNSIDELTVNESVGKNLRVTFDTKTLECTVTDDGSGIPHEKLLDAFTVLHTSGKFDNGEATAYTNSGGTFGVGAKCSVFLSTDCSIQSMRKGKSLGYTFKDGIVTDEISGKSKLHGTIVKFTIDDRIVAISEVTAADIKERLKEKSYIFPDLVITFTELNNDVEVKTTTYTGCNYVDLVKKWAPDTDIIHIENDSREQVILRNLDDSSLTNEKIIIDLAMAFKEDVLESETDAYIISFANSIKTYDGGAHVDGIKSGITKWFKNVVTPKMSKRDSDLPIAPSDITAGLCAFISVKLFRPEFSAQHKSRLTNQEVKFAVRDAVYDALCDSKKSVTDEYVDFIKRVTRGRMSSKKVRKKDVSNAFSKERLASFTDIMYTMDTDCPELVLVEGLSAADNAARARDPHNQAIYPIKKPKNIYDSTTEQVLLVKTVFNDILDICGLEPGKKCDPDKSVMRRILMLTDGDVDGDNIAISMACLLAKHCRPLIDAGMVGRILPPAYSFPSGKGDKKKFVRSKREFFDILAHEFVKESNVSLGKKKFSKDELHKFIFANFDYDTHLDKLANRYCCSPKLMENIAWLFHGTHAAQKKSYWSNALKMYPGLRILVEHGVIVIDGHIEGDEYVNLALDDYFERHVNRFKELQSRNSTISGYSLDGKGDYTLYDIMRRFRKYIPKGVTRFKGLGELDPKDLQEQCMRRDSRTVIIFKFDDFEDDMRKIDVIMSTKVEHADARSRLLSTLRIDDIEIDT